MLFMLMLVFTTSLKAVSLCSLSKHVDMSICLLQFVSALYIYQAKLSLLFKTVFVMSLPAVQHVLSLFHSHLFFMAHDVHF